MKIKANSINVKAINLGIVVSEFNTPVTDKLLAGAMAEAERQGIRANQLTIISVPGAVEIPLIVKRLVCSQRFDAVIALGAVIRGQTSHYDYVCQQVSQGCQKIMLKYGCPVIFGVLTTETAEQAVARAGGAHSDKGKEAIETALAMISIQKQLDALLDD